MARRRRVSRRRNPCHHRARRNPGVGTLLILAGVGVGAYYLYKKSKDKALLADGAKSIAAIVAAGAETEAEKAATLAALNKQLAETNVPVTVASTTTSGTAATATDKTSVQGLYYFG